jgi:hypothetical protein
MVGVNPLTSYQRREAVRGEEVAWRMAALRIGRGTLEELEKTLAGPEAADDEQREKEKEYRQKAYEQVSLNIRLLADIRFRLLALVPTLGGIGIALLSRNAVSAEGVSPEVHAVVFTIGVVGFVATLGIAMYDQRNSQLYNDLVDRAKKLEIELYPEDLPARQFADRPRPDRFLLGLIPMKHDIGLALIYGTVLGAWGFPIAYAGTRYLQDGKPTAKVAIPLLNVAVWPDWLALRVALILAALFITQFLYFDGFFRDLRSGRFWQGRKRVDHDERRMEVYAEFLRVGDEMLELGANIPASSTAVRRFTEAYKRVNMLASSPVQDAAHVYYHAAMRPVRIQEVTCAAKKVPQGQRERWELWAAEASAAAAKPDQMERANRTRERFQEAIRRELGIAEEHAGA